MNKNNETTQSTISTEWVDQKCYYYKKLTFKHNTITTNCYWGYVFGKVVLPMHSSFSITFNKYAERVAIGLACRSYSQRQSFAAQPYSISYYDDGRLYVGENQYARKNGFKAGEKVKVEVNLSLSTVSFKVDEEIRYHVQIEILKDNVQWVPFVYLARAGDSISID